MTNYFKQTLDRYPVVADSLSDTFAADTIRSLFEIGLGGINDKGVKNPRRFAEWMRYETCAPYALRAKGNFITPMQHFSIIVNKERDMALLHDTAQELQRGHDVVIVAGDLHGTVVLEAFESAQYALGWRVNREDIPLAS